MTRAALSERYPGWALVTGAARSEGLGNAFATQLAGQGMNLVLVDVLSDELEERARELRERFGVTVTAIRLDLSVKDFIGKLFAVLGSVDIRVLVCNHMYTPAHTTTVLEMELDTHHRMIDINARAYTTLVHAFGRRMVAAGNGAIVIVASGSGLITAPYTGAYSANKAFQVALGEALWYELQGTGVDVLVMIGGLMRTQGDAFSRFPQFMIADPLPVAGKVLESIGIRHMVVPGTFNRIIVWLQTHVLSRRRALEVSGRFMAKGLGHES